MSERHENCRPAQRFAPGAHTHEGEPGYFVMTPAVEVYAEGSHYPEDVSDEIYQAALDAWRNGTEYLVTLRGEAACKLVPVETAPGHGKNQT